MITIANIKFTKGTIVFVAGYKSYIFQGSAKDCKYLACKYPDKFCGYIDGRKCRKCDEIYIKVDKFDEFLQAFMKAEKEA